jgi:FMN-dependent NADH-azoreductase
MNMRILNIVTSPRKEKSASTAIVNVFLSEYGEHARDVTVDRLDIWQEQLPEFDAEAINAKYKGVSGEPMTPVETATWEKIVVFASLPTGRPHCHGRADVEFLCPLQTKAAD